MFLFKKIVSPIFFPLPSGLLLVALGLALLWLSRRQRAGKLFVTAGFTLLTVLSYGWIANPVLNHLERFHPPLASVPEGSIPKWVVVLGGGASSDPQIPLTGRLSEASLARLVEGLRWHRQIPGSRLILSGGSAFGTTSDAEAMLALAAVLGIAPEKVETDRDSLDTETQARNIKEIVKGDRFILVTSASHMRRAIGLFKKVGLDPIPAPTHYLSHEKQTISPADFYPSNAELKKAEVVVYEYLGLAWAKLRGRL